jgi:hypothetical protein
VSGKADLCIEDVLEVSDDTAPRQLAHRNDEGSCERATNVFSREHGSQRCDPVQIALFTLELDLLLDFEELAIKELLVVRRTMQARKNTLRFVVSIAKNKPAWREWNEEDQNAKDGWYR